MTLTPKTESKEKIGEIQTKEEENTCPMAKTAVWTRTTRRQTQILMEEKKGEET